jgi:hypothetical protein
VPELPDFGHPITPRQMIQHTSGLRDQYALFRLAGWRDDDVQAFDDVLEFAFRHRRLNFTPGSEYSYCNTSYTLLALIAERVSGKPLREVIRERLFEPVGMTSSHVHDDVTAIVPGRASAYAAREGDDGGFKVANSTVEVPGAICVYTTVRDLAHWMRNYREREVAVAVLDDAITPGRLNDGSALRYGYGLALGQYRGQRTVSHGGVDSGYRAEFLWLPDADFGVIVLANLASIKPGALARKVADVELAGQLGADEFLDAEVLSPDEAQLQPLAGLYRDARTGLTRRVAVEDGKLTVNGFFGERLELAPIGKGRFRLFEPPIEIRVDGREYRELPADGRSLVFTAAERATPDVATLTEYAGTFYCDDIATRWSFLVHDGQLHLHRRRHKDEALEPTIADAFALQAYDLVFSRDGSGAVNGLDVFAERIRYLRFERET